MRAALTIFGNFGNYNCEVFAAGHINDSFAFEGRHYHRHHLSAHVAKAKTSESAFTPAIEFVQTIDGHHVVFAESEVDYLLLLHKWIGCRALNVVVLSVLFVRTFAPDVNGAALHSHARLLSATAKTNNSFVVKHVLDLVGRLLVRSRLTVLDEAKT